MQTFFCGCCHCFQLIDYLVYGHHSQIRSALKSIMNKCGIVWLVAACISLFTVLYVFVLSDWLKSCSMRLFTVACLAKVFMTNCFRFWFFIFLLLMDWEIYFLFRQCTSGHCGNKVFSLVTVLYGRWFVCSSCFFSIVVQAWCSEKRRTFLPFKSNLKRLRFRSPQTTASSSNSQAEFFLLCIV